MTLSGSTPGPSRWLARYAVLVTASALVLICLGGVVTSKGVGMAVPDWPTSFGYNMFFLPLDQWWGVGGIHDEHLHRLVASSVGLLTAGLAVWLQLDRGARPVRRLGWIALVAAGLQALLGGLRVLFDGQVVANTTLGTVFGILHGCLGQTFVVLLAVIALRLSRFWARLPAGGDFRMGMEAWRRLLLLATGFIGLQLVLGAFMRHQHAGLAIPDFPLAYGQLWPATDADSLLRYNQRRTHDSSVTAFQIQLQILHRLGAVAAVMTVFTAWVSAVRRLGWGSPLTRLTTVWAGLLTVQFALGMLTIWTNKAADVATAHVAVGALSLVSGCLLILIARRPAVEGNLALTPRVVPDFAAPVSR